MKRIVFSLLAIGLVSVAVIGATTAFFQDVETSEANRFQAGELDLQVDSQCSYNGEEQEFCTWNQKDLKTGDLFFDFGDIKPGDFGEDTVSLHLAGNNAWVCAELGPFTNTENGCNDPEEDSGDVTCGDPGEGEGELGEHLQFDIWADVCEEGDAEKCDNLYQEGCDIPLASGPANGGPLNGITWAVADSNTNVFGNAGEPLQGGETYCLGVAWNTPLETNNIIQGDSLTGDLGFTAVQARHMDDFVCGDETGGSGDDDCVPSEEVCDGVDNNCNGLVDEGLDGEATSCGTGVCSATGQLVCRAGSWVDTCEPGTPGAEVCDGQDNDCDGSVDEDLIPPACSLQDGVCQNSAKTCNGADGWSVCGAAEYGADYEVTETSCEDGLDNDCNGAVDSADSTCVLSSDYCEINNDCMTLPGGCTSGYCDLANNECVYTPVTGGSCTGFGIPPYVGVCEDGVCVRH